MNIHEYQAKELLAKFGIAVPAGHRRADASRKRSQRAKQLPGPLYVVKAQIHAGGRGKGKFKELAADAKGGVRLAKSLDEVEANAREMLGNTLVTIQTGDAGKQVNRLYVTDGVDIAKEYYLVAAGRPRDRPHRDDRLDRRRDETSRTSPTTRPRRSPRIDDRSGDRASCRTTAARWPSRSS